MARKARPEIRERALQLTSSFEGGWAAVAGDFDGQILSWGPLQWNLGQGTLYHVLRDIPQEVLQKYLGSGFVNALNSGLDALRAYVRANLLSGKNLKPEARQDLVALATAEEARRAFLNGAVPYFLRAEKLLSITGWETARAYALAFDTAVQNGAPRRDHLKEYGRRLREAGRDLQEWEKLKVWAKTVADLANPRWREDVLSRKLTIALGKGMVHGRYYNLEDYGLYYWERWYQDADSGLEPGMGRG